ncbi:MAG: hypothetical protein WCY11_05225 [Novosphingobium sp.]
MSTTLDATDPRSFRDVLGCCPTSVAVITAQQGDNRFGLVVGTGSPLVFLKGGFCAPHSLDLR